MENLISAGYAAMKGKGSRENVIAFRKNFIEEICLLHSELFDSSYQPGSYRHFYIYEKKKRKISAAPFRDRVVHHALCNKIMPVLEKSFIDTSFANRKGKGTHRAVKLCQRYSRKYTYTVKLDVKQYFPSIDHEILKGLIFNKIKCTKTQKLIEKIIAGYIYSSDDELDYFPGDTIFTPSERPAGLPIGNLTSQYFANVYLTPLDHFIIEKLKIRGYIRYVDDFLLFHDDKKYLKNCVKEITEFLYAFRVRIHANRAHVMIAKNGISFLGYRVFPDYIRLARENIIHARRRVKKMTAMTNVGKISKEKMRASQSAREGHAKQADTWKVREVLFTL